MQRTNPQRAIFLFVRQPEAGRVKTRLARTVGEEQAANIYQILAEDVAAELKRAAARDAGLALYLYATPVHQIGKVALWLNDGKPPILDAIPQPEGGLDHRLAHAVAQGFSSAIGAQQVYLIGTDCPEVTVESLDQASRILAEKDAVIGRAQDGGFYLLGLSKEASLAFYGVEYSTEQTADQLVRNLEEAGLEVDQDSLPLLRDIDTEEDLYALSDETRQRLADRALHRQVFIDLFESAEWMEA